MSMLQAIILGLVQGATEFVPVSSSAHLVLVPWWLGWTNPGLAFDSVLHLGTLLAVIAFFWRDLCSLAVNWWHALVGRDADDAQARIAWWIVLGTVPGALMGILWEERFETLFHRPLHVAFLLLVTGCWLAVAERSRRKVRRVEELGWREALAIGLAQGCAIAPGISRSGATIGAGMLLGLERKAAARYSFLLATPIIFGTGTLQVTKLLQMPDPHAGLPTLALGFVAAFASGYACIRFLLTYVKTRGLGAFSVYCWALGVASIVASSWR